MSVYTQYGTGGINSVTDIAVDESYSGFEGIFRMIEESSANEHAIFESIINQDFAEVYNSINPAIVSESQLEAIQEANVKAIWSKVVDFIENIGKKILGIIKNLRDKIQMVFIRDGKELVKKYESQVNTKLAKQGLTKMKYKYSKPTGNYGNGTLESKLSTGDLYSFLNSYTSVMDTLLKSEIKQSVGNKLGGASTDPAKFNADENAEYIKKNPVFKPYTDEQKIEIYEEALGRLVDTSPLTAKEFAKEFDQYVFEEEKEEEGLNKSFLTAIMNSLTGGKKELETLKKHETSTNNSIKKMKSEAEKVERETNRAIGTGATNLNTRTNMIASKVTTALGIYSKVSGAYYAALGASIKKDLKQCRSIFTKAATYNQKESVNDQAILLAAIGETSDYEVDEMFDNTVFI